MQKFEVVIKKELFEALGLSVGRCFAYTDENDSYVRVNGENDQIYLILPHRYIPETCMHRVNQFMQCLFMKTCIGK